MQEPSDLELIAQYVLEVSGKTQLAYTDYEVINQWLNECSHVDHLLLILSELLPEQLQRRKQVALDRLHTKVQGQLRQSR